MSDSILDTDRSNSYEARTALVSVVIPVYNRLELLPRTLKSVLNQTYGNLEIIIVDDGSSEDIKSILDKIKDSRICCIRHDTNRGVAAAWNTGVNAAHGRYITFLGSDDEWFERKIEKQIINLNERGKEYRVSYCLSETYLDSESRILEQRTFDLEGNILHNLLCSCVIGMNSLMILREDVLRVGEFDERLRMNEDWDFLIRLASHYRFSCVREILSRDHWHKLDQLTKNYYLAPKFDRIIYERNRTLFDADRKANAIFLSVLAFREGYCGKKKEAVKLLVKSIAMNPFVSDPYIKLVLLATNKLGGPGIIPC